ncbi:hypothetical protein F5050DRAFT_1806744 [Lentinula boryana]|uniref:Uncharacterized protein n=1 Tax=Lentinula boryana TaxID=40481 RepID=A0ABQ8QGC8_9AGAR|nr:hypothetical protein F5050DRAFT_1806744 [Lentinula boryana]
MSLLDNVSLDNEPSKDKPIALLGLTFDPKLLQRFEIRAHAGVAWVENELGVVADAVELANGKRRYTADSQTLPKWTSLFSRVWTMLENLLLAMAEGPALMSFTFHSRQKVVSETAIGVGKKCCQLCWRLKDLLDAEKSGHQLILPGTHGGFHTWIPPSGLPESVLKSLRDYLVELIRTVFKQQVVQASYEYGNDTGVNLSKAKPIGLNPTDILQAHRH